MDELNLQSLLSVGTAAAVSLVGAVGGRYDLTSRRGWILMQVTNGVNVQLRQDYTLPDGYSIVACCACSIHCDAQSGIADNDLDFGISLNDDDAGPRNGHWASIHMDTEVEGWRWGYWNEIAGKSTPINYPLVHLPEMAFLRIMRAGLYYYAFLSFDGETWVPFGYVAPAAEYNNVWIFADCGAVVGTPLPILGFDWIRQGGSGIDPW